MQTKPVDLSDINEETKQLLLDLVNNRAEKLQLVSAYKLTKSEIEAILKQLFAVKNINFTVDNVVDKSILAGLVVKFGYYYVDYSLKGKLDAITENLNL